MSLDAMKLALEALEHVHRTGDTQVFDLCYADHVIPALRAAIEEAEKHEPVAWMFVNTDGECEQIEFSKNWPIPDDPSVTRLYAAPREWQGLTDEEKHQLNDALNLQGRFPIIDAIEARLKEKNT